MRYDKELKLMKLTTIEDGQGGYEEFLEVSDTHYANTSAMNMEVSEKLFGKVSTTAINCVVNAILDLDNNGDTTFLLEGKKYGLVKFKTFRNKTHLYLEIMDNE
jgi:hypothetical protein